MSVAAVTLLLRVLEKAMLDYLDQRNENPKPFVWTADADLILGKVERLSKRIPLRTLEKSRRKAHDDGCVGEVERWPPAEIDEINHRAACNDVSQITSRSAKRESSPARLARCGTIQ